jgi:hypothetical protein
MFEPCPLNIFNTIILFGFMFIYCMPKYMALNSYWNKNTWELLEICILNIHGLLGIINLNFGNS